MSSESDMVAVTISPWVSKKRTTSAALRLSLGASSCAVEPRSIMTSPSGTGACDAV
jgi:head-tail adaptor